MNTQDECKAKEAETILDKVIAGEMKDQEFARAWRETEAEDQNLRALIQRRIDQS